MKASAIFESEVRAAFRWHDLHAWLLPNTHDGNRYSSKAFAWLRLALREWRTKFIALVDDDAFINVGAVLHDLHVLSREQQSDRRRVRCMVYGGVEWYALERNTGLARFFGYNARQSGFRWRFSHGTYVPRADRRSHPHAQRIEARRHASHIALAPTAFV